MIRPACIFLLLATALTCMRPAASQETGARVPPPMATAAVAADPVPASANAVRASDIARRLHRMPGLREVTVTATTSGLRLDGMVDGSEDRALAAQIASQPAGMAAVDNRINVGSNLSERLQLAFQQVVGRLIGLIAKAPLFLVALAIVLMAGWIGRTVSRRIHISRFSAKNPYIDTLAARIVNGLILLAGVLVALDLLGATAIVSALLGSAGVVGIALGFAFRDIAENYVAGILLSLRRPFSPGDHILVDRYEGKVVALTSRSTLLMTFDGVQVALPNALVFKSVVSNFSQNPTRRFEFAMVLDTGESIRESQELAVAEIAKVAGVLDDPAPSWMVDGYMNGGIQLRFQGWVNQHRSDLGKVRSEALRAVKAAFDKSGIDGPQPVQYMFTSPLPPAIARRIGMAAEPDGRIEPEGGGDTSVNHDIDAQVAAQRQVHDDENLI